MNLIDKKIKYYSRKAFKLLFIALVAVFIIFIVINNKYKPMYKVSLKGEEIGMVSNRSKVESEIQEYIEKPQAPIVDVKIDEKPQYELSFASRSSIRPKEEEVLEKIDESADKTYKIYNIKLGDESLVKVAHPELANEIVNEIKNDRDFDKLEIQEEITKELDVKEKEEAKQVAYERVEQVQEQQRKEAEEKRRKLALASRSSRSMGVSVSPEAHNHLKAMRLINPVGRPITTGYYGYRGHTGVDMQGTGMTVKSANSGVVTTVKKLNYSYGHYVIVDHGGGVSTLYAHLSGIDVSVGDRVSKGEQIATSGRTGNATGPHLHFEIRLNGRPINPEPYI